MRRLTIAAYEYGFKHPTGSVTQNPEVKLHKLNNPVQ